MIINTTTSFCNICGISHSSTIELYKKKIIGRVNCPRGEKLVQLSSDSKIFMEIRRKSSVDLSEKAQRNIPTMLNFIDITNACNFSCLVCGVNIRKGEKNIFLSTQEIYYRAKKLRDLGGKNLMLSGGEPTIHPELPLIIKKIRALGLHITMASNGFCLGTNKDYAKILKHSGLSKVLLQFDTFNEDVHQKLRGNKFINEKIQAAKNIVNAGLRLGIVTTVNNLNIDEVDSILEFGLSFVPKLSTIVFQTASPVGRYLLPDDSIVDREQIIKKLLNSEILQNITIDHIWPLPVFRPWGLNLHPDCAVNIILGIDNKNKTMTPLNDFLDIERVYRCMNQNKMKPHWWARNIVPLYYILTATRRGKRIVLLRHLKGLLLGGKREGAVIIGIGGHLLVDFQDEQRLARCANSQLTSSGFISPCIYNFRTEKYPGSRKNDELNERL